MNRFPGSCSRDSETDGMADYCIVFLELNSASLVRGILRLRMVQWLDLHPKQRLKRVTDFFAFYQADMTNPASLPAALVGIHTIIDCCTARPEESVQKVDWEGKVALIQCAQVCNLEGSNFHFELRTSDKIFSFRPVAVSPFLKCWAVDVLFILLLYAFIVISNLFLYVLI